MCVCLDGGKKAVIVIGTAGWIPRLPGWRSFIYERQSVLDVLQGDDSGIMTVVHQ